MVSSLSMQKHTHAGKNTTTLAKHQTQPRATAATQIQNFKFLEAQYNLRGTPCRSLKVLDSWRRLLHKQVPNPFHTPAALHKTHPHEHDTHRLTTASHSVQTGGDPPLHCQRLRALRAPLDSVTKPTRAPVGPPATAYTSAANTYATSRRRRGARAPASKRKRSTSCAREGRTAPGLRGPESSTKRQHTFHATPRLARRASAAASQRPAQDARR